MNKYKIYLIISAIALLVIAFIAYFFTNKSSNNKGVISKYSSQQGIITILNPDSSKTFLNYDTLLFSKMKKLSTKTRKFFAYSIVNEEVYFYTQNTKTKKQGLTSFEGKTIIKEEYDEILTPNLTAEGYIELRSGEKYGLVNLKTGKVLKPRFQYIFPTLKDDYYFAFGYDGWNYFGISEDLSPQLLSNLYKVHNIGEVLEKKPFKVDTNSTIIIINPYKNVSSFTENKVIKGVVQVNFPSYIRHLGINKLDHSLNTKILSLNEEVRMGGYEANELNITSETKYFFKGIKVSLIKFWNYYISLRNYENEKGKVLVESQNGKKIIFQPLYTYETYEGPTCDCGGMQFVEGENNNTLIESINELGSPDIDDMKNPTANDLIRYNYYALSDHNYYKIDSSGNINHLKTNRFFQFTKFKKLKEEDLKNVCLWGGDDLDTNFATGNLRKVDLELMINEIYADYGYIFEEQKYKQIFENEKWYKPTQKNVDHLLSEIDKHNIQIINTYKDALKPKNE